MAVDDKLRSQVDDILGGGSGSSGTYWNFSNPSEEDFAPTLVADLIEISFVQKKKWNAETRKFEGRDYWDDGNPKVNFLFHFMTDDGRELLHELSKRSKCETEDWLPVAGGNLANLIGQRLQVEAAQPPINPQTGQPIPFSSAMRRTFKVTPIGPSATAPRGVDYESYSEVMSHKLSKAQPQQPVAMPPNMTGNPYARQYAQQQAYQQPAYQQPPQQPAYQQPVYQQPPQQAQPGYTAAAPTPVQPPVEVYEDLPF